MPYLLVLQFHILHSQRCDKHQPYRPSNVPQAPQERDLKRNNLKMNAAASDGEFLPSTRGNAGESNGEQSFFELRRMAISNHK